PAACLRCPIVVTANDPQGIGEGHFLDGVSEYGRRGPDGVFCTAVDCQDCLIDLPAKPYPPERRFELLCIRRQDHFVELVSVEPIGLVEIENSCRYTLGE